MVMLAGKLFYFLFLLFDQGSHVEYLRVALVEFFLHLLIILGQLLNIGIIICDYTAEIG
jgi:hypothetical protein